MACTVALVLILALAPQGGGQPWHTHYERGVALVEAGDGAAAIVELERALEARPEPALRLRTYGLRYVDYLPHLYLAVASHMVGDAGRARHELAAADRAGVAAESELGSQLLGAYQVLLGPPAEVVADPALSPPEHAQGYRDYERKAEVLPEGDFQHLRSQILDRCGLPPNTEDVNAPWYFHYELGVTLVKRGDPQRALDALVSATDRSPVSRRNARMYGMWFTDYRPYLEIAQAHVQLGNWECAFDALALSRQLDEVVEEDQEFDRFMELTDEATAHLQQEPE
jgi:tetratricopeptide (TPR) repeat protein